MTTPRRGAKPDLLRALRTKLRRDMPITKALGLRVVGREGTGLVLTSPLAPNINHKGTAFAGSLNATATLAGWGTIWLVLREHGIKSHVVIQDSAVHYFRPVTGDFTATCKAPSASAIERLVKSVAKKGRGRIELDVTISDASGDAVRFHGRYVAMTDGGAAGQLGSGAVRRHRD
ncbi:MAG: thioesterase domain-containing protein [Gemmatimonadales bacterium]